MEEVLKLLDNSKVVSNGTHQMNIERMRGFSTEIVRRKVQYRHQEVLPGKLKWQITLFQLCKKLVYRETLSKII